MCLDTSYIQFINIVNISISHNNKDIKCNTTLCKLYMIIILCSDMVTQQLVTTFNSLKVLVKISREIRLTGMT